MEQRGMIVDALASTDALDSSGEQLLIENCDISSLDTSGLLNYEHLSPQDAQQKKVLGQEHVGTILYARKLLKEDDCENDRQRWWWKKLNGLKGIYIVARLFDGAGHDAAKALAATIRDHHAHGGKVLLRCSVEGGTTERRGQELTHTYARNVALTYTPCNRTCDLAPCFDPQAPEGFDREIVPRDQWAPLVKKSERSHRYRRLVKALGLAAVARALRKTLIAGTTGSAAPGQLEGGAALQREHISGKREWLDRAEQLLQDYGYPYDRDEFRRVLKQQIPDVDEDFLDGYQKLVDDREVAVPAKVLGKGEGCPGCGNRGTMEFWRLHRRYGDSPESILDPKNWHSRQWGDSSGRRAKKGVSACVSVDDLRNYFRGMGGHDDNPLLVHFRGHLAPEPDHDEDAVLTHPEEILGVSDVPADFESWEDLHPHTEGCEPEDACRWGEKCETHSRLGKSENPHLSRAFLDESSGVVHLRSGSWAVRLPGRADYPAEPFLAALQEPRVQEFLAGVVAGWAPLDHALRAGLPPDGVLRLAVLLGGGRPDEAHLRRAADLCARHRVDGTSLAQEWASAVGGDPVAARIASALLGASGCLLLDPALLADLFWVGAEQVGAALADPRADPRADDLRAALDRYYAAHHPVVRYLRSGPYAGLFPSDAAAVVPGAVAHWLVVAGGPRSAWTTPDPFAKGGVEWARPMRVAEQCRLWLGQHGPAGMVGLTLRYAVGRLSSPS